MGQVRADLSVIASRIDQQHPGRATSLAIRTATFLGRPEEHNFVIGAAAVILIGFGLVLLDRLRKRGEHDAGSGYRASTGNCRASLGGSEPVEVDSAIADRKRDAGVDRRRARIDSGVLVVSRHSRIS